MACHPAHRRFCVCIGVAALVSLVVGCSSRRVPPAVTPMYCSLDARQTASVVLVGDAGAAEIGEREGAALVDPVLRAVRADAEGQLARLGPDRTAVVFLGDNVYPDGLVPAGHGERAHGEAVLDAQIRAAGELRLFFTLGNHDWNQANPVDVEGRDRALEQGRYLESHPREPRLLPAAGCAGPDVVDFGRGLRFVFVDMMGWLLALEHPEEVPRTCPFRSSEAIEEALAAVFRADDGRTEVVIMHQPLTTAGPHGGHYTWKQHLFPLTDFWPNAWIPLPVLGSAYPLSRQLGVTSTDLAHADYERLIAKMIVTQSSSSPTVLVAGHDHSLQIHRERPSRIHVVSGAGSASKVTRVERVDGALMAIAVPGYVRLDEYDDGWLRLTVVAIQEDARPREIFQTCTRRARP